MNLHNVYLAQFSIFPEGASYYYLPYSVGSIWAYAKDIPEIHNNYSLKELFFKRDDLDVLVESLDSPSIFGFSIYMWNENFSIEAAKRIKKKFPDCLIVFGGPSVPENSKKYLENYPWIDLCVHNEGEAAFANILLQYLENTPDYDLPNVSNNINTYFKGPFERINNLHELPSPYIDGVFDDLVRNNPSIKFNLSLETNRGCPFSCTFCDWGTLTHSKVKRFGLERVYGELEWAAENKIEFISIADANFGIFIERDNLIVDKLIELKNKTGFPQIISTSWNKNMKFETVGIAKKLFDAGLFRRFTASVQSFNEDTLVAIKRKNLDGSDFENIVIGAKKQGLPVSTEIIIGLPLETYDSYLDLIEYILDNDLPYIYSHLQVLKNSEMSNKDYVKKYGLDIIKSESSFSDKFAREYEYLVVGTNTLPRQQLLKLLVYQWYVFFFNELHLTDVIAKTLKKVYGINATKFYDDYLNFILSNEEHILHEDFVFLANPIENECLAVLDNYHNIKHYHMLNKIFNNQSFYNDLKTFCIDTYGCDKLVMDDAIKYQLNNYRYKKYDEINVMSLAHNLPEFLDNKESFVKKPSVYKVVKEAIPDHFTSWYYFLRAMSWSRQGKSLVYEI